MGIRTFIKKIINKLGMSRDEKMWGGGLLAAETKDAIKLFAPNTQNDKHLKSDVYLCYKKYQARPEGYFLFGMRNQNNVEGLYG